MMLLINLFDAYIVYKLMTIFLGRYTADIRLTILAYAARGCIGTVLNEFLPYPIISVSFFLLSTFLVTFCHKSKFEKKLMATVLSFVCNLLSEFVLAILVQATNFNLFEKAEYGNIFTYIIIKIIFWFITLLLQHFKGVKLNVKLPKAFIISVIIVPISSIIIELIILSQHMFDRNLTLISLFCVLASSFITIYLYDSYSKIFQERTQVELIKREQDYYKKQSELLQQNQETLRQFRHDIKNRIIAMQQMLEDREISQALEYTQQIATRLNHTISYSETGNLAIDSIINYKLTLAAQKGIRATTNIAIPNTLDVDNDDIVIILGNLLDNAIEANEHLEENKYINLTMKFSAGCLAMQTKNSFDSIVHDNNGSLTSRKDDKIMHGIGMKSIQTVVDRYNGYFSYEYDDTEFQVILMIYANKK